MLIGTGNKNMSCLFQITAEKIIFPDSGMKEERWTNNVNYRGAWLLKNTRRDHCNNLMMNN